ncbi:YhcH/YjgK/YiaL family protein [Neobacillus sp. LXY-4]|uniref:YhcH/YjgK/YiaL family protein n=1 Tax=Neobacillus sp. LXY-4 TaxID=3379826 RepID=UPI003EDFA0D0
MILDKLTHLLESSDHPANIQTALQFLADTDFSSYELGKHIVNDEMFFFLSEYETKDIGECFWESHQTYLDFHYILVGSEKVGYEQIDRLTVKEAYDAEKDAIFFNGELQSAVSLSKGDVLICFPQDGHMTGILAGDAVTKVRKVILKVKK